MSLPLEVQPGQWLHLLPQRAAFDPQQRCLLVADAHLGKAVSYRRLGVPVPEATTDDTLRRLDEALAATAAHRIVFLGDLLHSARANAPQTFEAVARWRRRHAGVAVVLVRGNHDAHAGDPPADWDVQAVDEPMALGPWQLCHHPRPRDDGYVLAGHQHPCIALGGRAQDRLRLPCFHFGDRLGVLPAFGAFTGMHAVRRQPGDRVAAVAEDRVVLV